MQPADLRAETPAFEDVVYLNTGASGPSPRRVVAAATGALEGHEFDAPGGDGMYEYAFDVYDESRRAVADHLGTDADSIALTQSTTDGIARVAAAMDWGPGDVVVRTDLEHAAGVLPWRRLRERVDIEVRVVETREGRIDREAFADAVEGADLATFSSLTWTHGTCLPVRELTEIAHEAGARALVDAVQSVGQRSVDVEAWGADAVAAAGHKWLLGPWGAGFLALDPEFAETLQPAQLGYRGVEGPYEDPMELAAGAQRFELGTSSPAPYAGLVEAAETAEEIGLVTITDRIERLTDRLKDGLGQERLVSPREYESGLVSFTVDDPEATVERLAGEGIRIRALPRPETVRASVHAVNTAGDVDALLEAL